MQDNPVRIATRVMAALVVAFSLSTAIAFDSGGADAAPASEASASTHPAAAEDAQAGSTGHAEGGALLRKDRRSGRAFHSRFFGE